MKLNIKSPYLPNLLSFILVVLWFVLVPALDNNGHYKEANVSQQDQHNWHY